MNRSEHTAQRNSLKKKLAVSFSGGRTSAFMLKWLWNNCRNEFEILPVFANTGKENEETLKFVHRFSIEFEIPVTWVEAKIDPTQIGNPSFSLTDFHRASRNGEPFEQGIKKYGLPNIATPWCTDKLKIQPMFNFLNSVGWKRRYTAIGIRTDEIDRINPRRKELRLIYPLISMRPTTKKEVFEFWSKQSFDLNLKSYEGNCDACYKKSMRSLQTIAVETPSVFKWWQEMEMAYGTPFTKSSVDGSVLHYPKRIYRDQKKVSDIISASQKPFDKKICDFVAWQSNVKNPDPSSLDLFGSCAESCEIL